MLSPVTASARALIGIALRISVTHATRTVTRFRKIHVIDDMAGIGRPVTDARMSGEVPLSMQINTIFAD
ncbi:hypothetical protein RU01_14605 [Rhodococcus sp. MEB064]|nr:hypothetical protein RU01_14605 [Rhodococcus sp. MEB064]